MSFIKEKIKVTCKTLFDIANRKLYPIENVEIVPAPEYKQNNEFPTQGWKIYEPGSLIRGWDTHYWLRAQFTTPEAKPHTAYYIQCTTGREGKWDATNPQSLIYLNGEMSQACDTNHTEIYLQPATHYTMHNYFYIGMEKDIAVPVNMVMCSLDEKSEALYYDMQTAWDVCQLLHENSDEYITIMSALEQTANLIDFRDPGSEQYYASVDAALSYIRDTLYGKLSTTQGKPIVSCIGHTHIDVEWKWDRLQTREKIQRSFATAATLMEKYPEYKFMLSQPELYRYLKEEAPQKYAQLKELVKQGRWEPEGAMYVEADCNLISGESFVRQILQGKKFFKDEFGVDCKILFLPDVFGYSAAMPQILRKSGIDHFVTSKISWSETNVMPVDSFLWQGIDGTEIFTNFITAQGFNGMTPGRVTTYVGMLTPKQIKGAWNKYLQKEYANRAMTTYGYGDGGGGPTKKMLETQRRLAKGLPGMPATEMTTLAEHLEKTRKAFDEGCKRTGRTPKWVGELYLEFHRGTYTSIARIKRDNRKAELALQMAEALSYTDLLSGGSYDDRGIWDAWTKVLHNQFHDIIPGSSIFEVYEGTDKDYAQIRTFCTELIGNKLAALASAVDAKSGVLVYNALGFPRAGAMVLDGKTVELSETIPAFGWKVIDAAKADTDVTLQGLTAENKHYVLTLDESGAIASLFDKRADRQVLKAGCLGNQLQVFEDYPKEYDNWEITDYYKQKMWLLDEKAVIEPVTDGSRAGFKVTKKYMHSTIEQHIWLYSESERIDFETKIDWHEHHQLLKTAFPLDVHATEATYEIQYGHVRRPTHENTSWDKAKFEVYGHKWVDMSENGYGVSLLNDCKYGFSTEGSTLKLTMLKCGTDPNPEADQGLHLFTYSLVPHVGDFREAGIIQQSYSLNQPLVATAVKQGSGALPAASSLVSCDKENVIIDTVKKAEADDGMIVRMYEAFDRRCNAYITVSPGFRKAYLCDLMENELRQLALTDNTVNIPVSNFEIVTVKFVK